MIHRKNLTIFKHIQNLSKKNYYFRDCWYLYTLNPLDKYLSGRADVEPDQTIEILMTDLDPKVMQLFTKNHVKNGHEATKV